MALDSIARKNWLGVEFRHLAALTAIAEEGSFRGAANRLGYVQSAVSQQIAVLERSIDARLVERSRGSNPVTLTDAGQLLLNHFYEILAKLSAAWADVEALGSGRAGVVRIGTTPSIEAQVVPQVLLRLSRRSEIVLDVRHGADDVACAALVENELDAVLASKPPPDGPLVSRRVIQDPLMLLVHADAPLARGGIAPPLAEIGALTLIGRQAARDADSAVREFEALGIRPRIAYASDDDATVRELVASGVGAAILPALSVDWDDERTVALPLSEALRPRTVSLVWHAEREMTAVLETFCDETLAACRDIQRTLDERLPAPSLAA